TDEGCQVEKSVRVTVAEEGEPPVISATADGESCDGRSILSTQLGFPVQWLLDVDGEIHDLDESLTLAANQPGLYIASYLNENGCQIKSEPFVFELAALPELTVSGFTTICAGESITLSVQGLDDVVWSDGQAGQSITVSPDTD